MASSNSLLNIKKSTGNNRMSKIHQNPLQILLQMGFPKHRAEKALAATGNYSAESATHWLLSHVNDPFLDDNSPREFILYACPKGRFLNRLKDFWQKSLELFGWNGAHNYFPHITLVSFFKTPDEDVPHLIESLESVMEKDGAVLNESLKLETYTSPNFMGFFVAEDHADYLKRIAMRFVREVSNAIVSDTYEHFDALTACFPWCTTTTARCIPRGSRSISLEPHVKSLHLTLAYQFPSSQYNDLKVLVDELDTNDSGEWELCLYSRDPRLNEKQVYKVVREYNQSESDDLELKIGDYLYVSSETLNSSTDGWLEGTSWLTGCSGFFPESYTERTSESDVWTLHKNIPLNRFYSSESQETIMVDKTTFGIEQLREFMKDKFIADLKNVNQSTVASSHSSESKERKLYVMRHGERVDFVFGTWIPYCFDETGNYVQKDLNMPANLPSRKSGPNGYDYDTPITNIGLFQAKTIGENFKGKNCKVDHVFCSPSFRCLQTCDSFLQGLGVKDEIKIKIEPALFEWTAWYQNKMPEWMSKDEMVSSGFNIDLEYVPFIDENEIKNPNETYDEYCARSAALSRNVTENYPNGNILFVGHGSSLDVCTRNLLQKNKRSQKDFFRVLQKTPYCGLVELSFDGEMWKFNEPPCPPMTHSTNNRFDWRILDESE